MRCVQSGKETAKETRDPHCGAVQNTTDALNNFGDVVSGTTEHKDLFCELGNITICGDLIKNHSIPSIDPFQELGNLDGSSIVLNEMVVDMPATGGFKDMDELISPIDDSAIIDGQEQSGITDDSTSSATFMWKKWMTVVACCMTIICLALWAICSDSISIMNGEADAQLAENALGTILEAPILAVNTEGIETPVFLSSIESRNGYEILSFEKTQNGAVATMRVYSPDVYSIAKGLDSNNTYTNEDVLMNALDNALRNAPIVEKQVMIDYVLTEEGYVPVLTVEFLDAYYGGIYRLRDEIIADVVAEVEG